MITGYLSAKFLHIFIAILSLGTSAGMGIVLELYGDHPSHGAYVLRAIDRIEVLFVTPGYVLMLATGLWMVHLSWPLTTTWIQAAIALWVVGLVLLGVSLVLLHRQIKVFSIEGPASARYRRIALFGRGFGAGAGFLVIFMLYVMVFKPWP